MPTLTITLHISCSLVVKGSWGFEGTLWNVGERWPSSEGHWVPGATLFALCRSANSILAFSSLRRVNDFWNKWCRKPFGAPKSLTLLTWLLTLDVLQAEEADTHIVERIRRQLVGKRKRRDAPINRSTEALQSLGGGKLREWRKLIYSLIDRPREFLEKKVSWNFPRVSGSRFLVLKDFIKIIVIEIWCHNVSWTQCFLSEFLS